MATEIKVPDLGEGIESGDVLEVFVSEGEIIEKDQSVVELETDKATLSVPSSAAGKVTKVSVQSGETVAVGAVLVEVEAAAEEEATPPPTETASVSEEKTESAAEPAIEEPEPAAAPEPETPPAAVTPPPAVPARGLWPRAEDRGRPQIG